MSTTDPNAFLMGGACPSAKFPTPPKNGKPGTTVAGTIESFSIAQQTEIGTMKPLYWDNGDKKMQLVVTLQTEERDDQIKDDDGRRRLFATGGKATNRAGDAWTMMVAIRNAIKAANATGLEEGGWLSVAWADEGEQTRGGFNKPKLYKAAYKPPAPGLSVDELM
jgi:hypothetical protein